MENTSRNEKPVVQLVGQDGNIFNLMGIASRALRRAGQASAAKEMSSKVMAAGDYYAALAVIMEYVDAR